MFFPRNPVSQHWPCILSDKKLENDSFLIRKEREACFHDEVTRELISLLSQMVTSAQSLSSESLIPDVESQNA